MEKRKIEAIILSKRDHRERDLLLEVLERNGSKTTIVLYGAKSGKGKGSLVEIGNQIYAEIKEVTNSDNNIVGRVEELSVGWHHKNIRQSVDHFFELSFYLEIIRKVAKDSSDDDAHYRLLSNAIYYLDEAQLQDKLKVRILFISKLLDAEGVFPYLDNCLGCESDLVNNRPRLSLQEGGFLCSHCYSESGASHEELYNFLRFVKMTPFKDFSKIPKVDTSWDKLLLDYLLFQFHWQKSELKTINSL